MNRTMISKLESQNYIPSIEQLESLSDTLEFEITDLFQDDKNKVNKKFLIKIQYSCCRHGICWSFYCNFVVSTQPCYCC
ncbi:hypothetical protein [Anaerococcus obesiensis]